MIARAAATAALEILAAQGRTLRFDNISEDASPAEFLAEAKGISDADWASDGVQGTLRQGFSFTGDQAALLANVARKQGNEVEAERLGAVAAACRAALA